jgi:hypothetical protein
MSSNLILSRHKSPGTGAAANRFGERMRTLALEIVGAEAIMNIEKSEGS